MAERNDIATLRIILRNAHLIEPSAEIFYDFTLALRCLSNPEYYSLDWPWIREGLS